MFYLHIDGILNENKEDDSQNTIFKELTNKKLKTNLNTLFNNVYEETSKIYLYFEEKLKKFFDLFDNNLSDMTNTMNYLEKIAIPNNTECTEIIDNIPGWRCLDCTEYDSIYCSNCYIKSKNLHKGHKIHYLPKITGMCDCGNPNAFKIFCPDHKGPYTDQKYIDEFINKSFSSNLLKKLNIFFDDLFLHFSKYLILTEKCTFFSKEILLNNIHNEMDLEDVDTLKENFCIVFQNFLTFLYMITNKNMGMLYLISTYILKNNFKFDEILDETFKTKHTCIKFEKNNIQILYENKNINEGMFILKEENEVENHKCECSFLRLLLTNWRDTIKSKEENQNEKLIFSFFHNIFFKEVYSILYFFNFKEIIFNYNKDIISKRIQYFSQDNILLIGNQTNLIENIYDIFYKYLKELLNLPISKDKEGGFNSEIIEKILNIFIILGNDSIYFIKKRTKKLINSKIIILKKIVDIASVIHNQCEYESIFPHPEFQEKKFSLELINSELILIKLTNRLNLCYEWEDKDILKDFFNYIINKILNQSSEKIKQLKDNEYSFHLTIYRLFGIFLNHFCFNYALNNNKNLIDAIEYIKKEIFNSKEEMQKVIDLIINDYFKLFGFITGIRNEYFNYYDSLNSYNDIYFNSLQFLKTDYTLLKYLLAMSDKKLNMDNMLKVNGIESNYSFFTKIFKDKKLNDKKDIEEDEKKHVMQWVRFFEIIISIMKNDSSHFHDILTYYNDVVCSKTKSDLFNKIKKNEELMKDLKNNLIEKLILVFIGCGNILEMKTLKNLIDDYYFNIFTNKEFNEVLNYLTDNKIDNKKIVYNIKDSGLKYLDFDYFFSTVIKSKAQIYINDFKKNKFKSFHCYYFKPSILAFDLYNKVFENILLNNENIEFVTNIVECLLSTNDEHSKYLESIKNEILPFVLNFITMIGTINSKIFIKYKIENKSLFNKILDILNNALKNNEILDNDLYENVIHTIKQLNTYNIIYSNIKEDINKLNDYDYNNENILLIENKKNNSFFNNEDKTKIKKNKEMKEKYKYLIKQKRNKFMDNIKKDKKMLDILENEENSNIKEDKDTIMCFFCRNKINLNSFKEPYGKISNIYKDYFYKNSFRSSIRNELNKIIDKSNENKNKIFLNLKENDKYKDISIKIISCGHYFHQKCFNTKLNENSIIKCPVCEQFGNILIPPLTNFYRKYEYLTPEKLNLILDKKTQLKQMEITKDNDIFKEISISFLQSNIKNKLNADNKIKEYNSFIDEIFTIYEYSLNYLYNLFICEATTFHKQQQIDNIQNLILLLRYLIKINFIDMNQILYFIRNGIDKLINGPGEGDNIIDKYRNMYYSKYIDKIIFLFVILLDYDEIQKLYLYVINWTLPYLSFWLYLRNIIIENNCYSLYKEKTNEKINIKNLIEFLNNNNKQINNYIELFLQKLLMIKIITKYDNKKDNITFNINNLQINTLFSELNLDNIYQKLSKDSNNEINIIDIMEKITQILVSEKSFIIKDCIILDYNKFFNLIINNIIKIKEEKYLMNAEFFYQFVIYKFQLIELDNNIFDFIERNLFKNCYLCNTIKKKNFLCLICGNKICLQDIINHVFKCTFSDIIYIDMQFTKLFSFYVYKDFKLLYSLYSNEFNEGPDIKFISNEYKLNKEKMKLALRSYVCMNFH